MNKIRDRWGEAGDQLVEDQLGVGGAAHRTQVFRLRIQHLQHRPGTLQCHQNATHHHLQTALNQVNARLAVLSISTDSVYANTEA